MLSQLVGLAVVPPVVLMLIVSPVNYFFSEKMEKLQEYLMDVQQDRIRVIGEILQGILVVKMFGWEEHLKSTV